MVVYPREEHLSISIKDGQYAQIDTLVGKLLDKCA